MRVTRSARDFVFAFLLLWGWIHSFLDTEAHLDGRGLQRGWLGLPLPRSVAQSDANYVHPRTGIAIGGETCMCVYLCVCVCERMCVCVVGS
ncbi:uncharacterized protein LY79DRAFT_556778 [Colletotrichum navitas]|uniref:Secreted protein n=1 Tax=Colletotrichum navitas TaxID=681940 RepID=A0AAD8PXF9_9PEZI|nr:uncharacterized protein LY79DRAFT_556778 [Colletotrichum navitas]KAK1589716.1 hypothetical protein LY79DRAFT_556778 [Colletotrichum navitas]